VRQRSANECNPLAPERKQMLHGKCGAPRVVDVDGAETRRAQIDQYDRPVHGAQVSKQLRLDKSCNRYGVRCVEAHLLGEIMRRAGREYRWHQPPLAAGFFETVQNVRKKRADCEIIVLAMKQERDAPDSGAKLGSVVAKLSRRFDHAFTRRFRQARLVFKRSRYRAD
jgi:hypothetical protein